MAELLGTRLNIVPADASMSLAGLCVLNPRPARQAHALTAKLTQAGANVFELPLLEIVALELTAQAREQVLSLDRYDATIFVSANAARLGLAAIADYWPQWPHALPAYAVGPATKALLDDAGLSAVAPEQENSEGLLALPGLTTVHGQRLLLLRGDEGRELLPETLRARGAQVDVLPLYTRRLPSDTLARWQACSTKPDVVLLSSALIWQHWQQIAGAFALQPVLIAVSQRLAAQVRAAGAEQVFCSDGATPQAWLNALQQWQRRLKPSVTNF
ncbi:MAG: uroporphyrinogen-III synthase [Pseudomonadota bacterium]